MHTPRQPAPAPAPALEDFDVPVWRGLVPARLRPQLEAVIAATLRTGNGDEGVVGRLRDLHLSEIDRARLTLAWRLWRGWGSALEVQQLWGIDRELLIEVLSAIAHAARPEDAGSLLREAASRADALREAVELAEVSEGPLPVPRAEPATGSFSPRARSSR